jgi:hypothetical protein
MRAKALAAITAVTLAGTAAGPTVAAIHDLTVRNNTRSELHFVYVVPANSADWEQDRLGFNSVVLPYSEAQVSLSGFGDECMFDIRVVDEIGNSNEYYDIDLCTETTIEFP